MLWLRDLCICLMFTASWGMASSPWRILWSMVSLCSFLRETSSFQPSSLGMPDTLTNPCAPFAHLAHCLCPLPSLSTSRSGLYTIPDHSWAQDLARRLNSSRSSWVHGCGRMGHTSRCCIVCSSPHSHVVCPSSLNPQLCIRDAHRPVPVHSEYSNKLNNSHYSIIFQNSVTHSNFLCARHSYKFCDVNYSFRRSRSLGRFKNQQTKYILWF